jgi:hypothetical protein
MRHFKYSFIIAAICLLLAFAWGGGTEKIEGGLSAMALALILGVMEVSLSFDNAVVNAGVLKDMDRKWQQIFLTIGILIAVFGMRLLFPILIVSSATGQGFGDVAMMALHNPDEYSRHLEASHVSISAFGGMFLFLVFLHFMIDEAKDVHWIDVIEGRLMQLGKLDSVQAMIALAVLYVLYHYLPLHDEHSRTSMLAAGVAGIILYILVSSVDGLFENEEEGEAAAQVAKRAGIAGFLYLEVLDASFSFDGVIGAFAITRDVVIIMLGLAIGAMFVRSLTVYLVNKGTLDEYIYLEHGAHWAIGILAGIMLASITFHIPEVVTGLIGVAFIVVSLISSESYNLKQQGKPAGIVTATLSLIGIQANKTHG